MRRRDFITLLGGAAAAWPVTVRAQQVAMPVIGFLGSDSPEFYTDRLRAFRNGLKETGHVEGQNFAIEYRWAQGRNDRLPALAEELIRHRPAAIVTSTTPSALALKVATATIPVVFFITTPLTLEVGTKWLQLLHEMVPAASGFAIMLNPTSPDLAKAQARDLHAAAGILGLQIHLLHAASEHDFDAVFARVEELRAGGLIISSDSFFFTRVEQLAAMARRRAVPTIFGFREYPVAGGLMSYGANLLDAHRGLGVYTGRILKGEKPADLPVQQAVKVDLVINMATARALRIDVSPALLIRADEVIE
jgi:ABC-type uncharacterized transport system substrate-binding protein